MKCEALFTKTTAKWNGNKFVGHRSIKSRKLIEMEIDGDVLRFRGGPTGFESYCIKDLSLPPGKVFCICGGTVNSWPRCEVQTDDVIQFLKENGHEV